jgi:hypothetical protein
MSGVARAFLWIGGGLHLVEGRRLRRMDERLVEMEGRLLRSEERLAEIERELFFL